MAVVVGRTVVAVLLGIAFTKSQGPISYTLHVDAHGSVNGSSPTGHCSSTRNRTNEVRCLDASSSVLFDGNISTLPNPDNNNMWASQLLTLNVPQSSVRISTTFSFGVYRARLDKVEIAMFNCPQWGIGVDKITLFSPSPGQLREFSVEKNVSITSCDSLVRVCVMCTGSCQVIGIHELDLTFHLATDADWVHMAEVEFFFNATNSSCPSDVIIYTPTTPPSTIITPSTISEDVANGTFSTHPSDITIVPTSSSSCSTSNILTGVITAITTALVATVIFVLLQSTLCKCHPKFLPRKPESAALAKGEELAVYEQVDGGKGGRSDPIYMEVGAGRGSPMQFKKNEAYATAHFHN